MSPRQVIFLILCALKMYNQCVRWSKFNDHLGDSASGQSVPECLDFEGLYGVPFLQTSAVSWVDLCAALRVLNPHYCKHPTASAKWWAYLFLQVQHELLNIKNCVLVISESLWCFVHRDYSLNIYLITTWRNLCGAFTW